MGDITTYNGGAVLAMVGENCVAIATDKRLGMNSQVTISSNFPKAFRVTDKAFFGASGLATDVQTFKAEIEFRANMFELNSESQLSVTSLAHLVSSMLYSKRFGPYFIASLVAGIDKDNKPVITCFDLIGAPCNAKDFVVIGTCTEQLYGICESLYESNLGPERLFETISQCLLAAVDRDCLSGWGAEVHVITPYEIITRTLKTRMD
ncbi:bifunctional Proteasome beta-type subunit [Babesia duncani]|uniref:Proteasome subunit beta n=1 Tax=Babesia duncani TaxID=323732 RepID=A0AAD9PKI9_9APIC|nr:bifunctional Proteasome beta-type subunit [Babesia duncani]